MNVPKPKVKINEEMGFTENGYSFCGKIEEVLFWENYCMPLENRNRDVNPRLFLIDTLDSKVVGCSSHYKAEQIVVLREITHDEIVRYFTDFPELRVGINEESWKKFCKDRFEEYKLKIDTDEINKTLIQNCIRLGKPNLCKQDSLDYVLSKCKECKGQKWIGDVFSDLTDYYYLHARKKIYNGMQLEEVEEYWKLKGCEAEQNSLRYLVSGYRKINCKQ